MTTLDAQRFEGKQRENAAIQLSRDLFLDSLTFAITAITIGFPALSWVYSYVSLIKVTPTIRCFPPDNLSLTVSTADLEYFCQYNQTLHAAFFPVVIAFFAFWIAVPHFIWRNYHTGKFDLFISLVTKLKPNYIKSCTESTDENQITAQQLVEIFLTENKNFMFISYIVVKVIQATVALFTCLLTVILYHTYFSSLRSIFTLTSNVPTFDCDVDKFDAILNFSSPNIQVPCIENFSRSTAFILFVDFILLLTVFLVSIGSIVWHFLVHPKELEHDEAAKFSYHTGMSLHCYKSKFDLKKYTASDLDFLIVLLRRTDRSLAELLWEARTRSKIELLTNDDLMRSNLILHPRYRDNPGVLDKVLKDNKTDQSISSLRKCVLEFSSSNQIPEAVRETAVYITFVPYSFGIPLELSRAFSTRVVAVSFDPFFKNVGGLLYQIKEWPSNFSRLTFPAGILSSDSTQLTNVGDALDTMNIRNINLIVIGPLQNTTVRNLELLTILNAIHGKLHRECKMLVITPQDQDNIITKSFTPPDHIWHCIVNQEWKKTFKSLDGSFVPELYKK